MPCRSSRQSESDNSCDAPPFVFLLIPYVEAPQNATLPVIAGCLLETQQCLRKTGGFKQPFFFQIGPVQGDKLLHGQCAGALGGLWKPGEKKPGIPHGEDTGFPLRIRMIQKVRLSAISLSFAGNAAHIYALVPVPFATVQEMADMPGVRRTVGSFHICHLP